MPTSPTDDDRKRAREIVRAFDGKRFRTVDLMHAAFADAIAQALADEREGCAMVAERADANRGCVCEHCSHVFPEEIAAAIRARGESPSDDTPPMSPNDDCPKCGGTGTVGPKLSIRTPGNTQPCSCGGA